MFQIKPLKPDMEEFHDARHLYMQIWDSETGELVDKHTTYDGWAGFVALDGAQVVGLSYGYRSQPEQWFHDKMKARLDHDTYHSWMMDCFEFVELIVHPDYRRQRLGIQLHDVLLSPRKESKSVLVVDADNVAARQLYSSLGWEIIDKPGLSGEGSNVLMGIQLPYVPNESRPTRESM